MAKLERLIQTNIVALYPNLDLRAISPDSVRVIADEELDPYGSSFFQNPNGMKLVLPQRKVEIDITQNKIQIADLFVSEPTESDLITRYYTSVSEVVKPYISQIYGFNYIFEISIDKKASLLTKRLYNIIPDAKYKYESLSLKFHKETDKNATYVIKLDEQQNGKFSFVFNFEISKPSDTLSEINAEYIEGFNKAKGVIDEL